MKKKCMKKENKNNLCSCAPAAKGQTWAFLHLWSPVEEVEIHLKRYETVHFFSLQENPEG